MKKQWLVLLVCCFFMSTAMAAMTVIHVTKSQPSFTINLPANATTGYSWVLGKHDPLIQLVTYTYYPSANKQLMGAPGHVVFQFKVIAKAFNLRPQPLAVELVYERPWNHQIASQRIFSVQITS